MAGAPGPTRTDTPWELDFESSASTIPPRGHARPASDEHGAATAIPADRQDSVAAEAAAGIRIGPVAIVALVPGKDHEDQQGDAPANDKRRIMQIPAVPMAGVVAAAGDIAIVTPIDRI